MEKKKETLAEVLREQMQKRNLKQGELAALLEIPDSRLSEFMHGKRKLNLDLAKRLRRTLGIGGDRIFALAE